MPAPKFQMKSLLTKNVLHGGDPLQRGKGEPFTFYWCRDTHEMFFTDSVGNFVNFGSLLASVLDGSLPLALPASPVAGPQGPAGRDGAQGPIGLTGATGAQGPAGPRGEIFIPSTEELAAAVIEYRRKHIAIQAALLTEIAKAEHLHPSTRVHIRGVLARIQKEVQ
jgi:hypothetical protein